MDVKEVFANRLRELRIAKKLSQTELAEKFGVQRQVISYFETGSRKPDINFIYKVAQFFNVSTDFLLGYDYHGAQNEIFKGCTKNVQGGGLYGLQVLFFFLLH